MRSGLGVDALDQVVRWVDGDKKGKYQGQHGVTLPRL